MIVKSPAGATVVTLGDTDVVNGYLATFYDDADDQMKRIRAESTYVGGDFEVVSAPGPKTVAVKVYIEGADWAGVTTKWAALREAVRVPDWQLTVGTVTWTCNPADINAPIPELGIDSNYREVTLTIPVIWQDSL